MNEETRVVMDDIHLKTAERNKAIDQSHVSTNARLDSINVKIDEQQQKALLRKAFGFKKLERVGIEVRF
ncbi:hypothetical protein FHS16_003624 [Paenibacillus endophyticus]|uniref:Uncharacterized protein n=1 Tax=Paenibacillus endophyticus TaxID=1294268 RepID=A0A7W5C9M8_9BACL|nr:hypothetical protein [Paenibacillus endophyticus]MBB3153562.1 hypothetical protein [Paenibacillus endophyticus]